MAVALQTKPGTRKLSEVCRKLVVPSGIVSTAWPSVRATCNDKLGITFDDWQDGAGRVVLAKRADGKLACTIGGVGMSVCRQVGKTYFWSGLFFGLAVNNPGFLAIWSAHHARTHGITFQAMQAFCRRSKVAPYIDRVYTGSGDEEVRFLNGSSILFGARERGFGRGIPGVDAIMADEGQIMSERAVDDQMATLNTSDFGLFASVGTPPRPEDRADAFTRMRNEAWAGTLEDSVWIEIGAEPGTDPNDRRQWSKWNPSHPKRTPVESILRLQKKLLPESFRREGMGTWDDDGSGPFPSGAWSRQSRPDIDPATGFAASQIVGKVHVAVDMSWDRTGCGLAVSGSTTDDVVQVELVETLSDEVTPVSPATLVERAAGVVKAHGARGVHLDPSSAAGGLIPSFQEAGVKVFDVAGRAVNQACGLMYDGILDGSVVHLGQTALDKAVGGTQKRGSGESWRWDRRGDVDISPFYAATFAVWAAAGKKPSRPARVVVHG